MILFFKETQLGTTGSTNQQLMNLAFDLRRPTWTTEFGRVSRAVGEATLSSFDILTIFWYRNFFSNVLCDHTQRFRCRPQGTGGQVAPATGHGSHTGVLVIGNSPCSQSTCCFQTFPRHTEPACDKAATAAAPAERGHCFERHSTYQ